MVSSAIAKTLLRSSQTKQLFTGKVVFLPFMSTVVTQNGSSRPCARKPAKGMEKTPSCYEPLARWPRGLDLTSEQVGGRAAVKINLVIVASFSSQAATARSAQSSPFIFAMAATRIMMEVSMLCPSPCKPGNGEPLRYARIYAISIRRFLMLL